MIINTHIILYLSFSLYLTQRKQMTHNFLSSVCSRQQFLLSLRFKYDFRYNDDLSPTQPLENNIQQFYFHGGEPHRSAMKESIATVLLPSPAGRCDYLQIPSAMYDYFF